MKYPFTKCLHPRRVQNKYTGDVIEVGCGVCKACLMNRASKMSLLCSLEEDQHRYCMFVTLTYADEFIPKMRPVHCDELGITRFISECDRLGDRGKVIAVDSDCFHRFSVFGAWKGYYQALTDKCRLNGCLSYVSVREAQLFMKRLRKNLTKFTDEKIRYYIASEYGPKTFRAHYHVLLYYDKEETQKAMSKCIRKSWPFGRIDASISRGKCSSYVAKYVNSNHFIPSFLGSMSSKPFSLHSQKFAVGFYQGKKEEIYEDEPSRFVRIGRVLAGDYVEFMPWRSLAFTFFPKCKGYSFKSYDELLRSYTILRYAKRAFGKSFEMMSLPQIAENIIDCCISLLRDQRYVFKNNNFLYDLCQYFIRSLGEDDLRKSLFDFDTSKRLAGSVTSELYVSRHFLQFCCDGKDDYGLILKRLSQIMAYWDSRDMYNLKTMYQQQLEYKREFPSSVVDWFYWNRKVPDELLYREPIYKNFVVEVFNRFEKSLKHKAQNDLNDIFIYG